MNEKVSNVNTAILFSPCEFALRHNRAPRTTCLFDGLDISQQKVRATESDPRLFCLHLNFFLPGDSPPALLFCREFYFGGMPTGLYHTLYSH
jgi:hypothetical protein